MLNVWSEWGRALYTWFVVSVSCVNVKLFLVVASVYMSHAKHWLPIKEPIQTKNWRLDLSCAGERELHLGYKQNLQLLTQTNRGFSYADYSTNRAIRKSACCFESVVRVLCLFQSQRIICAALFCQGNAWAADVCQAKAGWSSHEALPMILSWQPFVPAARHGNVAFATGGSYKVRAQCDCHTPWGPNTMWQGNRAHPGNHQDLIIWPFLFSIGLFPQVLSKNNAKKNQLLCNTTK